MGRVLGFLSTLAIGLLGGRLIGEATYYGLTPTYLMLVAGIAFALLRSKSYKMGWLGTLTHIVLVVTSYLFSVGTILVEQEYERLSDVPHPGLASISWVVLLVLFSMNLILRNKHYFPADQKKEKKKRPPSEEAVEKTEKVKGSFHRVFQNHKTKKKVLRAQAQRLKKKMKAR